MRKKVLVLYYSQSGQLGEVVDSFTGPMVESGVSVEMVRIKPQQDFDFPWTSARFFDAMPESVLGVPVSLVPFQLSEAKYDLILFAYQPWYLSPSIPATSILLHPSVQSALKNSPVVTLIGARNMWLNAQEKVKILIEKCGATLVGNVVLVDRNPNLISAITILYWMLTGKKDRYLGLFPQPGIAQNEILETGTFGKTVFEYLQKGNWSGMQQQLVMQHAVEVNPNLMFVEERAGRLFSLWANFIIKRKRRAAWLVVYKYYLLFALFIIAPPVLGIYTVFFRPFLGKSIEEKRQYYLGLK